MEDPIIVDYDPIPNTSVGGKQVPLYLPFYPMAISCFLLLQLYNLLMLLPLVPPLLWALGADILIFLFPTEKTGLFSFTSHFAQTIDLCLSTEHLKMLYFEENPQRQAWVWTIIEDFYNTSI